MLCDFFPLGHLQKESDLYTHISGHPCLTLICCQLWVKKKHTSVSRPAHTHKTPGLVDTHTLMEARWGFTLLHIQITHRPTVSRQAGASKTGSFLKMGKKSACVLKAKQISLQNNTKPQKTCNVKYTYFELALSNTKALYQSFYVFISMCLLLYLMLRKIKQINL